MNKRQRKKHDKNRKTQIMAFRKEVLRYFNLNAPAVFYPNGTTPPLTQSGKAVSFKRSDFSAALLKRFEEIEKQNIKDKIYYEKR